MLQIKQIEAVRKSIPSRRSLRRNELLIERLQVKNLTKNIMGVLSVVEHVVFRLQVGFYWTLKTKNAEQSTNVYSYNLFGFYNLSAYKWYTVWYGFVETNAFTQDFTVVRSLMPRGKSCPLNPLNPKIKIWILICGPYSFPTEVVGRSW